jgi:1-acyl-sn-glycerol-3-phosphate acyltransferase
MQPIIPVTIIGSFKALPPSSREVDSGIIRVIFHEPIPVDHELSRAEEHELMERVHNIVSSALPEDQQ